MKPSNQHIDYTQLFKEKSLDNLGLSRLGFEEVDWSPLCGGGSNFKTHKLVIIDKNKIEFVGTFGFFLFGLLFFLVGILLEAVALGFIESSSGDIPPKYFWLFPLPFILAGAHLLYLGDRPNVFNKETGLYWKGKIKIPFLHFFVSQKVSVDLENIKAVQLIKEHIRDEDSNYYSYEINLILHDNTRINVVDHGGLTSATKDAYHLADFLDVPILDGLNK